MVTFMYTTNERLADRHGAFAEAVCYGSEADSGALLPSPCLIRPLDRFAMVAGHSFCGQHDALYFVPLHWLSRARFHLHSACPNQALVRASSSP